MRTKRILALLLCAAMCLSICVSGIQGAFAEAEETTVTDMIGSHCHARQLQKCCLHWRRCSENVQLYWRCQPAVRRGGH